MKKIVLTTIALSLLLTSSAFAAGELGLGAIATPIFAGTALISSPYPSLQYRFNKNFTGNMGLAIGSRGGDSAFGISLRGAVSLQKKAGVDLLLPFGIDFVSAGDITTLTLKGGFGVETFIKSNFSVAFDLYPIMLVAPSEGDSSFILLGAGAIMAHYYL